MLGQTSPAYGGLGGGATWGITDWNFYGHYASFSGWESITHEFMHCMDYSHNSNMTYAAKTPEGVNVGWTEFIWQLHMWLSKKGDLPYTDRNLLGFHKPENAQYRDCDIMQIFRMMPYCRRISIVFTEEPTGEVLHRESAQGQQSKEEKRNEKRRNDDQRRTDDAGNGILRPDRI